MKHIIIYYFSGTGNTKYVADHLKNALSKSVNPVDLISIEDIKTPISSSQIENADIVGLCFPVYAFSAPAIIKQFISRLPQQTDKAMFHIKTAAGLRGLTQYASSGISRTLKKKGYTLSYDRTVTMGSNWFYCYDDRLVKQLALSAQQKVQKIAEDITKGVSRVQNSNFFQRLASGFVSYGEHHMGARQFGKSLRANDNCDGCKLCQTNCPQENIQMEDGKPVFGADCLWCMRCIYACPKQAIYSKQMQFTILKDGYSLNKVMMNDQISADFVDENTKGEYAPFYAYISDDHR